MTGTSGQASAVEPSGAAAPSRPEPAAGAGSAGRIRRTGRPRRIGRTRSTERTLWTRWTAGWTEALHAEWTKLRTLPGTFWLLGAVAILTLAVGAATSSAVTCNTADCGQDPGKISLSGVDLGQAVVAVMAVLMVGSEYSSGMIRVTLAAMPRRPVVLAAKAVLLASLTLVAGAVAVCGSILVAKAVMPGHGFTSADGYPPSTFTDSTMLRAAGGSVLYLVLIGLLSLGIATAVRDSAAGIGITLGLLYLSPIISGVVSNPTWHARLERYSPMNAGLAIQATRNLTTLPIGPWEGLGVLAAWTAAALLLGGALLRLRDA